jgi:hypothetical protein
MTELIGTPTLCLSKNKKVEQIFTEHSNAIVDGNDDYSGRQKKLPLDFGVYLKLEAMDFKVILLVD